MIIENFFKTAKKGVFYNFKMTFPSEFVDLFKSVNLKENFVFDDSEFYIQKDFDEHIRIFYRKEIDYWPILNLKYFGSKRNLILGLLLTENSMRKIGGIVFLSSDLELN